MASKKTLKPNIKPTAGHLLLEPIEAESKTEAGIYLPDTASEKTTKGEVVAVGADMENEQGKKTSSPVKKGDIVIYKKWGGSEVKIGAKEFLFAKFEDILAIVEN